MLRLMRATVDINAVRRKIDVVPNGVFTVEASEVRGDLHPVCPHCPAKRHGTCTCARLIAGNSVAHAEFRGNIFEQHSGVADVDGCCRLNERLASGIHSPESDGTNGGDSSCIALACDSGHALSVRDRTSGGKMTKVISSAMAHVGASAGRGSPSKQRSVRTLYVIAVNYDRHFLSFTIRDLI